MRLGQDEVQYRSSGQEMDAPTHGQQCSAGGGIEQHGGKAIEGRKTEPAQECASAEKVRFGSETEMVAATSGREGWGRSVKRKHVALQDGSGRTASPMTGDVAPSGGF